jgi:hypothetical protein
MTNQCSTINFMLVGIYSSQQYTINPTETLSRENNNRSYKKKFPACKETLVSDGMRS